MSTFGRDGVKKVLLLDSAPTQTLHSGKAVRLVHLFKRLSQRHELHYVAIVGPTEAETVPSWLAPLVTSTRIWRRAEVESRLGRYANWLTLQPWFYARHRYPQDYGRLSRQLRELVRSEGIDVVHSFDEEAAQFVPDDVGCAFIADPADAMALHASRQVEQAGTVGERLRWRAMAWRLGHYERQLVHRADATVFVSEVDASLYGVNGARDRVHVIPNGVDTAYFQPHPPTRQPANPPTLLFTGHMSFAPNRDAALHLIDDVLPLVRQRIPDAACYIVGAEPTADLLRRQGDGRHVVVTGRVADLRPYFAQASVYVCPMRLGAGIKNKLLEAMAMGCAIVATPRATEGLAIRDGVHLCLADGPGAMADVMVALMHDQPLRDRLGRLARDYVASHHSWDRAAAAYDELYRALVSEGPS